MVATNTSCLAAPPRRTRSLPAPTRLPAEPLNLRTEHDSLLDLAQAAIESSYEIAGDRASIERLGHAVVDLLEQLDVRTSERDTAREDFARARALQQVSTLFQRQRAPTVVLVQRTTIVVAAPRSQSMIFDLSDATEVLDVDQLPTPGHGQTVRLPNMSAYAASGGAL